MGLCTFKCVFIVNIRSNSLKMPSSSLCCTYTHIHVHIVYVYLYIYTYTICTVYTHTQLTKKKQQLIAGAVVCVQPRRRHKIRTGSGRHRRDDRLSVSSDKLLQQKPHSGLTTAVSTRENNDWLETGLAREDTLWCPFKHDEVRGRDVAEILNTSL